VAVAAGENGGASGFASEEQREYVDEQLIGESRETVDLGVRHGRRLGQDWNGENCCFVNWVLWRVGGSAFG
jgi:hypothetical protein